MGGSHRPVWAGSLSPLALVIVTSQRGRDGEPESRSGPGFRPQELLKQRLFLVLFSAGFSSGLSSRLSRLSRLIAGQDLASDLNILDSPLCCFSVRVPIPQTLAQFYLYSTRTLEVFSGSFAF